MMVGNNQATMPLPAGLNTSARQQLMLSWV